MSGSKANLNLHLVIITLVVILGSGMSLGTGGKGQAAQTGPGATASTPATTAATQDASPLAENDAAARNPAGPAQETSSPAGAKPSNDSPESIIRLLQDSKAAIDQKTAGKYGVHFTDNFTMSIEGTMINARAEGDVIPPDRAKLAAEVHMPYEYGNFDYYYEAIVTGGIIYVKPKHSRLWAAADLSELSLYDEDIEKLDYTQFVVNPQYLGEETMPSGERVHHVRVDIDAVKVVEAVEKFIKPNVDAETRQKIEQLKTSVITDDIWIGVDDLLVYQSTERFVNIELQISYDDMVALYNWGERIDISPPPASETVSLGG